MFSQSCGAREPCPEQFSAMRYPDFGRPQGRNVTGNYSSGFFRIVCSFKNSFSTPDRSPSIRSNAAYISPRVVNHASVLQSIICSMANNARYSILSANAMCSMRQSWEQFRPHSLTWVRILVSSCGPAFGFRPRVCDLSHAHPQSHYRHRVNLRYSRLTHSQPDPHFLHG